MREYSDEIKLAKKKFMVHDLNMFPVVFNHKQV